MPATIFDGLAQLPTQWTACWTGAGQLCIAASSLERALMYLTGVIEGWEDAVGAPGCELGEATAGHRLAATDALPGVCDRFVGSQDRFRVGAGQAAPVWL